MKNSPNLTQSSLRNDPINRQMQGYSFRIFEDEDGVQDVNSSFSFNKILILRIHWKRKWVKNALEQTARDLELYTRRIWRLIVNVFFVAKNTFYKRRKYISAVGSDGLIVMNDCNETALHQSAFNLIRRIPSNGCD